MCHENYHLCTYSELYSGAYMIARKNGWLNFKNEIWARESINEIQKEGKGKSGDMSILKIALCCSDK